MASRTGSILTIAGISLCGIIAYAVYFDYKRRTDSEFRKKIRKEKKRATENEISEEELREVLKQIKSEPRPPTQEAKENYFMSQAKHSTSPAAMAFYRALSVYPSPTELLTIYQKTVPEAIVKIILTLMNLDLAEKIGAYFDVFPPKWTNVSIQPRTGATKVLVLNKDVAAGEVIYKEHPMLTCLDYDLQLAGTHCTHCLREIQLGSLPLVSSFGTKSVFCSKPCQVAAKTQWHSLLLTLDPPLPVLAPTPAALEARRAAQSQFTTYLKKDSRVAPLLMADAGEYQIEDHVERWRTGTANPPPEEYPLIVAMLRATLPGLESFVSEASHTSLLGKITFNSFGVCFGGGRDNRPASSLRPEDAELTRTPYGTSRQVGTALYSVSSYLSHSCAPNARPSFSSGTSELNLIASKDLKKGDEVTIAYVDVGQRPGESAADCRLRRRKELARGWKFPCACSRCVDEASEK
ncbi:hypothetical protein C8R46DRAFT_1093678 [Mycena filopes]|nr:hypothetical protein C8R46DRAFT_1093678 [Mycena filopes]